jgi:hypothetical protein
VRIRGIDEWTLEEMDAELAAGGRFVFYEYCISLIVITLRQKTDVYLIRGDELGLMRGLRFSLISLLLGWWGIPWGFIYTPLTLITNFSGGRDVTPEIRASLQRSLADKPPSALS